jgi:hypothetical protein
VLALILVMHDVALASRVVFSASPLHCVTVTGRAHVVGIDGRTLVISFDKKKKSLVVLLHRNKSHVLTMGTGHRHLEDLQNALPFRSAGFASVHPHVV